MGLNGKSAKLFPEIFFLEGLKMMFFSLNKVKNGPKRPYNGPKRAKNAYKRAKNRVFGPKKKVFFLSGIGGDPPPPPLTENQCEKRRFFSLAEKGGTPPPLTESPLSFSGNFFPKRAKKDVFFIK